MDNQLTNAALPLEKQPIETVIEIACQAGRDALANAEFAESHVMRIAGEWVGRSFGSGENMPDAEFDPIVCQACDAFEEGAEEYRRALQITNASVASFSGVMFFFAEDNSLAFGLQIDLLAFHPGAMDTQQLYERFFNRLVAEYDRLTPHVLAARDEPDAYVVNPEEDIPISTWAISSKGWFLQIVPAAIGRAALLEQLPNEVRKFVQILLDQAGN